MSMDIKQNIVDYLMSHKPYPFLICRDSICYKILDKVDEGSYGCVFNAQTVTSVEMARTH